MLQVRFGIIGTNWITERFIQAAMENDRFTLTAVYSRTAEKGSEFASKYDPRPAVYTDISEMAASPDVDAVYIASPNSFHAEQAILCMKAGKHVLCEKPLASNTAEVQAMVDAARNSNVLLMEGMKSTQMPNFKAVRDHLYKLGRIRRYVASYGQYSSRYDAFLAGTVLNAFNPQFSNGSLMDLGVYCIYPAAVLFGRPESIKSEGILLSSGVDGEGSLLLRYPEMDAVIMHSKISDSYLPAEIQGENGTMVIDKINQPYNVKIHYRDGTIEEITQTQTHESMYYELDEFIDVLEAGKRESEINSHEASIITAEIAEEARRQIGLVYPADQQAADK
nr:Gfo/Idh/MocA family oxidoreductase [Paenibacillus sp. F411]